MFKNRKDRQLFEDIVVMESLKRNQGVSMYDLTACMVTHAMQMRGPSINRMEDILEEPEMQEVYGLDRGIDKTTCTVPPRSWA